MKELSAKTQQCYSTTIAYVKINFQIFCFEAKEKEELLQIGRKRSKWSLCKNNESDSATLVIAEPTCGQGYIVASASVKPQ